MSFVRSFQSTFGDNFRQGARQFEVNKLADQKQALEEQKAQQKQNEIDKSRKALFEATGFQPVLDPATGQETYTQSKAFEPLSPEKKLTLLTEMSAGDRRIYENMTKPVRLSDEVTNIEDDKVWNAEKGMYEITGIAKYGENKGNRVTIGYNQTLKPQKKDSYTIKDRQEIEGKTYGAKGKVTRVKILDDGTIETQGVGDIKTVLSGNKNLDDINFEANIADNEVKAISVKEQYAKFLADVKGNKFASETDQETTLMGINSRMNSIAFKTAKQGSNEAKNYIKEIIKTGKGVVGQDQTGANPRINTTDFYNTQYDKYEKMFESGELNYKDFQTVGKFLEYKYKNFIEYDDIQVTKDEIGLDDMQLPEGE